MHKNILRVLACFILTMSIFGCSNQNSATSTQLRDPDKNLDPRWKDVKTFAQSIAEISIFEIKEGKLHFQLAFFDFDYPAKDGSPMMWINGLTLGGEPQTTTEDSRFRGSYKCGDSSCNFGIINLQKVSGGMAGTAQIYFVNSYVKDFNFVLGKKKSNSPLGLAAQALKKYDSKSFNLALNRVQDGVLNSTFSAIYYDPPDDDLQYPFDNVTYLSSNLFSQKVGVSHHQLLESPDLHEVVAYDEFPSEVTFNSTDKSVLFKFNSEVLKEVRVKLPETLARFTSSFFKP